MTDLQPGLDYSVGRPLMAAVKRDGYAFVLRYLSRPGNPKNLTTAELADARAHGIGVGLVFELYEARAAEGYGAGEADAAAAHWQALSVGFTADELASFPVYFAVDYDAQPADYPAIRDYFSGVQAVLSGPRGVYGSYYVCGMLLDAGLVTHCWQTEAWSRGNWDPRFHIIQRVGYVTVDNIQCDRNELNDQLPEWGIYGIGDNMPSAAEFVDALLSREIDVPIRDDSAPDGTGMRKVKQSVADVLGGIYAGMYWGLGYNREVWGPGLAVQFQAILETLRGVATPETVEAAIEKAQKSVVRVQVDVKNPDNAPDAPAPPQA